VYQADLSIIAAAAEEKEEENLGFLPWLKGADDTALDDKVHALNVTVSAAIDCTACGNCCKTLVINVTRDEIVNLGTALGMSPEAIKETYIEESLQGACYMNTMPCNFLSDNKCTIYAARFTECRDFPHLHKPGFRQRLLGTLGHYGRCPIIYNVVEELKTDLGYLH
jgi:Fe-S-cluster containining protein